ncbi:MAG: hypothetical protein ACHQIL_04360 [Steroidobacterales bacterium]
MNILVSARLGCVALGICLALLGGCHKAPAPAAAADKEVADEGVTLSAGQVEKMGIEASPAKAASYTPEAQGYAVVMAHEAIAQAVAERVSAQAAAQQSRAALARIEHLAGTAGAMPADAQESATRQAAVDEAALALARQRLSAAFGQNPPWHDGDTSLLAALADGKQKLVRVTFPLGQLKGGAPKSIGLAHLDAARSDKRWAAGTLWDAPADASVPGRSFFALLNGTDASEGERLLASAPVGVPVAGVLIPESAIVISDGKYWCYVERKPGVFVRAQIDTHQPLADGYFMHEGISAGDLIVTEAAGMLLAREMNSGAATD